MNSFNPIRRSALRPSPRRIKERAPWHPPLVRLDAMGMAALRSDAFERSDGICECSREICQKRVPNLRRVTWTDGQLHHIVSRARGGSDELSNVQFITRRCHEEIHGKPAWSKGKSRQ